MPGARQFGTTSCGLTNDVPARLRAGGPRPHPTTASRFEAGCEARDRFAQTDPYAGRPLKFELAGYRSLRSSRYRTIYRISQAERVVQIHYFGLRRDVCELFRRLLRG